MPLPLFKIGMAALCVVALAGALYGSYTRGLWRFNHPSRAEYPVHGLDVSHHQGDVDWAAVPKDRFSFVYIKATEGGDYRDKKFAENWRGAREAGLKTGAYHFFTLCRDGKTQGRNFIAAAPREKDALPPVIDLEFVGNCGDRPPQENFLQELRVFSSEVEMAYGAKPVLYTTYHFYKIYLDETEFTSYPIWVRDVFGRPNANIFPQWVLWQYADNARVPGISGPVDLNVLKQPTP